MEDDLLREARRHAANADRSIAAAALLRIARVESAGDPARARSTLLVGLSAVRELASPERESLLEEARFVAAAVAPDLLSELPSTRAAMPERFASTHLVETMVAHRHLQAAVDFLLRHNDPASFPFVSVGLVLHHLDGGSDTRLRLLRRALEIWRQAPSGRHSHERDQFVRAFGQHWKEFPVEEACAVVRMIVDRALAEPDGGTSAGYMNELHFSSHRENTLFQILHVLRHLDPDLAQSLIDSHDQLAAGARRYPYGLETIHEEAEAEAKRRRESGEICGSGYIIGGDPKDFDAQRRLVDATRSGDFAQSIRDVVAKYREDTAPETRNYAPKEHWPSTGTCRTLFYEAGKRLGADAAKLLEQIPDEDLRLLASIELAAALAGVPAPRAIQMRRPSPPHRRVVADAAMMPSGPEAPKMRSPDGRAIRCPNCLFRPPDSFRWFCKCGHSWNTFWTEGLCPACRFQWQETQCPSCGAHSPHRAWYASET